MTRALNIEEHQLLRMINARGGSICPGVEVQIPRAGHKSLRWMAANGFLTIEETDDGPRFTLSAKGQEEAAS